LNYQEYVLDVFTEHHTCLGVSIEETDDMIKETPFVTIENWLMSSGYDLNEYYN
jgi:hypothetical protein